MRREALDSYRVPKVILELVLYGLERVAVVVISDGRAADRGGAMRLLAGALSASGNCQMITVLVHTSDLYKMLKGVASE